MPKGLQKEDFEENLSTTSCTPNSNVSPQFDESARRPIQFGTGV